MKDTGACGNPHIDNLAAIGRMSAVWDILRNKFPMVAEHEEAVWLARRDGRIRRKITTESRFSLINKPMGPENEGEWVLLAYAALEAAGFSPVGSEQLQLRDGIYLEMPADHPVMLRMHADCNWCATGWVPCPITNYPGAHVYVGSSQS